MNQDRFTLILTLDTASEPQKSVIVNIRCIRYIGFYTGAIILTIELNTYMYTKYWLYYGSYNTYNITRFI